MEVVAGIDIGGTKVAVAISKLDGERVADCTLPTDISISAEEMMERVMQAISEMLGENNVELVAIGIGCPSPLDLEQGLVKSPSNMRHWIDFPIVQLFEKRFNVPVGLDNDANLAGLGEFAFGAGRGFENLIYVTVSTGVGGCLIINGAVFHGVCGAAGEIGHTIVQPDGFLCNCGTRGCLETICAGVSIARRALERIDSGAESMIVDLAGSREKVSAKEVIEAFRLGDKLAVEIWEETCRYLAIGIANSISLLAPEVVIIGGGISVVGDVLIEPLRRHVPEFVSMVPSEKIQIKQAELGSESGLYGAVELGRRTFSSKNT